MVHPCCRHQWQLRVLTKSSSTTSPPRTQSVLHRGKIRGTWSPLERATRPGCGHHEETPMATGLRVHLPFLSGLQERPNTLRRPATSQQPSKASLQIRSVPSQAFRAHFHHLRSTYLQGELQGTSRSTRLEFSLKNFIFSLPSLSNFIF